MAPAGPQGYWEGANPHAQTWEQMHNWIAPAGRPEVSRRAGGDSINLRVGLTGAEDFDDEAPALLERACRGNANEPDPGGKL